MPNPAPGFAKRPDHTVAIHTAQGTLVVELDSVSPRIAKSTSVLALEEASYPTVYYIPLADLNTDVIVASDTETYCPFKGHASYYHIQTATGLLEDAVWSYRDPYDECQQIKDYVAFYPNKVNITFIDQRP